MEISGSVCIAALFYFSLVKQDIVIRSIAAAWSIGIGRLLPAITLWRCSNARRFLRFGAVAFGIFALLSFQRIVLLLVQGAPQNFMQRDSVQTISILTGFLHIGVTGMFLLAMITSELRAATLRIAQIDSLTGALTRAAAESKFAQELEHAGRSGLALSLMLIDVDNFKAFNDTAGHAAGDEALRLVSQAIKEQLRAYDTFGRFGGDELLLLLPGTEGTDAVMVAERIRDAVGRIPPVHGKLPITLSIGIAEGEPHYTTRTLLARADSALYHVKRSGRDAAYFQPFPVPLSPPHLSRHCLAAGQSHAIPSLRLGAAARCHPRAAHSDPGAHLPEPGPLSLVSHPRRRDGLCLRRSWLTTRPQTTPLRRPLTRPDFQRASKRLTRPSSKADTLLTQRCAAISEVQGPSEAIRIGRLRLSSSKRRNTSASIEPRNGVYR
ncbi:MAG: GGDEF domain-containing protein [Acidobacteria bacterium]|nr:GGDEF domain-containing protein [Acidobacteriota bacterium]